MDITLAFHAPRLLELDASSEAVVACFQWPGSNNVSTVTVKRVAAWVGSSYIRTETGEGAALKPRELEGAHVLHWDYETSGIKEYVTAIKGLRLPPLTQETGIVVGGLYKFEKSDELVTVVGVSPRVRVSEARGGAFYRVRLLLNDRILNLKVSTKTFRGDGWILVTDDIGRSKRVRGPCHDGAMLKALCSK